MRYPCPPYARPQDNRRVDVTTGHAPRRTLHPGALKCMTEHIEGDTARTVHAGAVEAVVELLCAAVMMLVQSI